MDHSANLYVLAAGIGVTVTVCPAMGQVMYWMPNVTAARRMVTGLLGLTAGYALFNGIVALHGQGFTPTVGHASLGYMASNLLLSSAITQTTALARSRFCQHADGL